MPDVFGGSEIDTGALGTPMGNWPSQGCNIDKFFAAQTLVLDITLCGGEFVCAVWVAGTDGCRLCEPASDLQPDVPGDVLHGLCDQQRDVAVQRCVL